MHELPEGTTVEEANPQRVYDTANGGAPRRYATAEDLLANAPKDITEQDVEDVFGGLTVRVRGLTAAQSAHVKEKSLSLGTRGGQQAGVAWAQMEITQFELGVIEPKMTHDQVLMLHRMSGPSFAKVIQVIDDISGIGKEELRKAQEEFQE